MRTVKEVSNITGISVRTLHYYDEIGLLKPSVLSEAGYRLYDDKALETLRHILFLRELDLSLGQIKEILENSGLDKEKLLKSQKKMLVLKKERLERIIASIDDMVQGGVRMDFEVFNQQDIKEIYQSMVSNMNEEQKALFVGKYGSMEAWEKNFMETASSREAQKNLKQVAEWYGSKEAAIEASKNPDNAESIHEYQKQLDEVIKLLAGKRENDDAASEEIQDLMKEYDRIMQGVYQMSDVTALMSDLAKHYKTNPEIQKFTDSVWGEGMTAFLGEAMEVFYGKTGA